MRWTLALLLFAVGCSGVSKAAAPKPQPRYVLDALDRYHALIEPAATTPAPDIHAIHDEVEKLHAQVDAAIINGEPRTNEQAPAPASKEVIHSPPNDVVKDRIPTTEPGFEYQVMPESVAAVCATLGDAIDAAAEQADAPLAGPTITVRFGTGPGCVACRQEKPFIPDVEKAFGGKVEETDLSKKSLGKDEPKVKFIPTWIIKAVFPDGEVKFWHCSGVGSHKDAISIIEAIKTDTRPVQAMAVGLAGPTLRIADAAPLVTGKTIPMGDKASISIPANLRWTVAQKPGSVVLSFVNCPTITVKKFITWRVQLTGLEITPTAVTLQTDSLLGNITAAIDWSAPK